MQIHIFQILTKVSINITFLKENSDNELKYKFVIYEKKEAIK